MYSMYYYENYYDIFSRAKNDVELMYFFQMLIDEYDKDLVLHSTDKETCTILQEEYYEIVDMIKHKYSTSHNLKWFIELNFN